MLNKCLYIRSRGWKFLDMGYPQKPLTLVPTNNDDSTVVAKLYTLNVITLKNGELERGVNALAKERSKWLERPDLLVRAARHYEGAAQILIRQAVMTAKEVS